MASGLPGLSTTPVAGSGSTLQARKASTLQQSWYQDEKAAKAQVGAHPRETKLHAAQSSRLCAMQRYWVTGRERAVMELAHCKFTQAKTPIPFDRIVMRLIYNQRGLLPSTATRKYRNMKACLRTHGGVATLAKACSLRCGLRLALGTNPSLSLCFATSGLQY